MKQRTLRMESPLGKLLLVQEDDKLTGIHYEDSSQDQEEIAKLRLQAKEEATSLLKLAKKQLEEYFNGERTKFDLPLHLKGSEFQLSAWHALQAIPYGRTKSYQEQAQAMGNPKMAQAVGQANGKNPLPIVVPCHRVVGKTGKLTGYSGGLDKKAWLIQHEAKFS